MKEHAIDVRLRRDKAVGDHFNSHGHSRSKNGGDDTGENYGRIEIF